MGAWFSQGCVLDRGAQGWVLDGYPSGDSAAAQVRRMQLAGLSPAAVIVLSLPDLVVEDRVSFRSYHPPTGRLYHMVQNPPPLGVGAGCVSRPGETTAHILARLADYHRSLPLVLQALQCPVPFDPVSPDALPSEALQHVPLAHAALPSGGMDGGGNQGGGGDKQEGMGGGGKQVPLLLQVDVNVPPEELDSLAEEIARKIDMDL